MVVLKVLAHSALRGVFQIMRYINPRFTLHYIDSTVE